jgi:hypothetical protein
VILTEPGAGSINTFGMRVFKYLNNVSMWWHVLGMTSLAIAILAVAPKYQSGKFVFLTFVDSTGVDGVGRSQRASPAHCHHRNLVQYTLTGWRAYVTQSSSVFSLIFWIRCKRAYDRGSHNPAIYLDQLI